MQARSEDEWHTRGISRAGLVDEANMINFWRCWWPQASTTASQNAIVDRHALRQIWPILHPTLRCIWWRWLFTPITAWRRSRSTRRAVTSRRVFRWRGMSSSAGATRVKHCRIHVALIVALLAAGIALAGFLLQRVAGEQAGATYGRHAIAARRPLTTAKSHYRTQACHVTSASQQSRHSLFKGNLSVEPDTASPTA
jgi:hypothetical protein